MMTMAKKHISSAMRRLELKIPGFKAFSQDRKHEEITREASLMIEETTTMLAEASAALQVRRLPVQEEPFTGFNSPPGRF